MYSIVSTVWPNAQNLESQCMLFLFDTVRHSIRSLTEFEKASSGIQEWGSPGATGTGGVGGAGAGNECEEQGKERLGLLCRIRTVRSIDQSFLTMRRESCM
jgi:hypothetical protein